MNDIKSKPEIISEAARIIEAQERLTDQIHAQISPKQVVHAAKQIGLLQAEYNKLMWVLNK